GQTDEGVTATFYADTDGDGFGDLTVTTQACTAPIGFVADSTDCNDNSANEHPGQIWYEDSDSDGFGNLAVSLVACLQPTGYVLDGTDWNDTDSGEWQDTDGDGVGDNSDVFPTNPNEWADADADGTGDQADTDDDNDGLLDIIEIASCTDPLDADTDDDGIIDGYEDLNLNGALDIGETDPCNGDTDGDGVQDGTELGYTLDDVGPHTDLAVFQPDLDPSTSTDPLVIDTDGDGLTDGEEYHNQKPSIPSLLLPINTDINVSLTAQLKATGYSDADGDRHLYTRWQISSMQGDFSDNALVLDIKSDSHLTSFTTPELMLHVDTLYYWRVKFYDNLDAASDWSETFSFRTIKTDSADINPQNNIPDSQEISDASMDLDSDGYADINQPDMKCLRTGHGNASVCVKKSTNVTSVISLMWNDPAIISDTYNKPDVMPIGLLSFKLEVANPGDIAEVTIYCSSTLPVTWYKYDLSNGWQDYSANATFNPDNSVTLQFKDGNFGDADGTKNRFIVDPSGPGTNASPPSSDSVDGSGGGGCFISSSAYRANSSVKILVYVPFFFFLLIKVSNTLKLLHKRRPANPGIPRPVNLLSKR
ncbi:MAG: hypothetical protein AMJ54_10560, partial [Deltaproteobacteria bacterium SG8_13]